MAAILARKEGFLTIRTVDNKGWCYYKLSPDSGSERSLKIG